MAYSPQVQGADEWVQLGAPPKLLPQLSCQEHASKLLLIRGRVTVNDDTYKLAHRPMLRNRIISQDIHPFNERSGRVHESGRSA